MRLTGPALVHDLSFRLERGSRTILLGANGSGKSVTLRLIHGLLTPTSGEICWLGPSRGIRPPPPVDDESPVLFQAMVFQRPVILRRSVRANVAYPLRLHGISGAAAQRRIDHALRLTGLEDHAGKFARTLSGGEQQRLALARAWALRPQLLLLDEPAANLDPASTRRLEDIVNRMNDEGGKILMSTHDINQAHRLADDIMFMSHGRLLEHCPAAAFFKAPPPPPPVISSPPLGGLNAVLRETRLALERVESSEQWAPAQGRGTVTFIFYRTPRLAPKLKKPVSRPSDGLAQSRDPLLCALNHHGCRQPHPSFPTIPAARPP